MIKIAICDDINKEIQALTSHIDRYAQENSLSFSVSPFSMQEDIVDVVRRSTEYDIIFMDIYIDALNGIELARKLNERGAKSRLIFVSTSTDHALDAFGVNALQYLVKPVSYDAFKNAMNIALENIMRSASAISVVTGDGVHKIAFDSFIYAETQRNYQRIHIYGADDKTTRMTSTELFNSLCDRPEFARVGVSYIVNLQHIEKIVPYEITFSNNCRISVPRRVFDSIKDTYFKYFMWGGV